MPLAWIASYPRSGNTWTRILLASYLTDGRPDWRIAELGSLHDAVPDLYDLFLQGRMLPLNRSQIVAAKTHYLPDVEIHQPYVSATTKVLYLIRNPRDVLPSVERMLRISPRHRTAFAQHFIAHRGFEGWQKVGFGSWPQHLLEWTTPQRLHRTFPGAEVCVVRYEDLKSDTVGCLHRMVEFLGFDEQVDPERVQRAVDNSALDKLRETERRDTTRDPRLNQFFGHGLSDQSLSGYGEDVEEAYQRLLREDDEFGGLAARYGYAGAKFTRR
jgi:hypothetical protein